MTRKEELVQKCTAASNPPDDDMGQRTRQYFEAFTEEDLEKEFEALIGKTDLDEQKEATRREMVKLQIFQTSGLANIEANEKELDRQLPGGLLTLETFYSLIQNEAIKNKFAWQTPPFQRAKQAARARTEADREEFTRAARELVLSPNEANFSLISATFGTGVSVGEIKQAVQSGKLQLLPASAEEHAEYYRQSVEEHNNLVRTLAQKGDPKSMEALRRMAREEHEHNKVAVPVEQGMFNLEEIRKRDSHRNFPPLPKGVTKFQLQSASPEYTATLVQKYGKYQLLARLMEPGE